MVSLFSEPGKDIMAAGAPGIKKSPDKFAKLLVAMCGLPGRGKSQVAQCLSRRPYWNGEFEFTKGEKCQLYLLSLVKLEEANSYCHSMHALSSIMPLYPCAYSNLHVKPTFINSIFPPAFSVSA